MFFDTLNRNQLFRAVISLSADYIYHVRGEYSLDDDGDRLIPVTRSYRNLRPSWVKDRLPHDEIDMVSNLGDAERCIDLFGKRLLFAEESKIDHFASPLIIESDPERMALGSDLNDIQQALPVFTGQLGVFGSYQCGFAKPSSDLDLVIYVNTEEERKEAIRSLNHDLRRTGWKKSSDDGRDLAYGDRYSNKLEISRSAGRYLASKRIRWTSPMGKPVSFQIVLQSCPDEFYLSRFASLKITNSFIKETFLDDVAVLDSNYAFNFPRLWRLEYHGKEIMAVSFEWGHQGMGYEPSIDFDKYRMKASRIICDNYEFLFLSQLSDFILPEEIL